jgi:hypothetical protein
VSRYADVEKEKEKEKEKEETKNRGWTATCNFGLRHIAGRMNNLAATA